MLTNIELIQKSFTEWYIWIYLGTEVPQKIIDTLRAIECVKIIETHETGWVNMFYRFFPIDDPSVDIAIIRDADSRVNERDSACIHDFIDSSKLAHIIRDHPNHLSRKIMAGMWGIKRGLLDISITDFFHTWRKTRTTEFWDDMNFLDSEIYPRIKNSLLLHDELFENEPPEWKMPFRVPIKDGKHFIGQVYEYDENGVEFPAYNY